MTWKKNTDTPVTSNRDFMSQLFTLDMRRQRVYILLQDDISKIGQIKHKYAFKVVTQ